MPLIHFTTWNAGLPEGPVSPTHLTPGYRTDPGEWLAVLDELGLPDALPEVREQHARVLALRAEQRGAGKRLDEGRPVVVGDLAAGTITLAEAVARLDALEHATKSRGQELLRAALGVCTTETVQTMHDHGEAIVDDLRPAVTRIVDESVSLAAELPPGVTGDREAVGAGGKAAETWARLGELHRLWLATHHLVDGLRSAAVLPHADTGLRFDTTGIKGGGDYLPEADTLARKFLPAEHRWVNPPGHGKAGPAPLIIARGQAQGRGPGIYTAAQVREHRAARAREVERTGARV